LQLKCSRSCNWSDWRVATGVLAELQSKCSEELQLKCLSSCNCTTPSVAIGQWFELQSMYTPSCKYWVLFRLIMYYPFSCKRCALRVANTECFRLILYYLFSCNRTVVWVAIDIYSELQILSASTWYRNTHFRCNRIVVQVAIDVHSDLQILSSSAWY
jgi:hypothetical protein